LLCLASLFCVCIWIMPIILLCLASMFCIYTCTYNIFLYICTYVHTISRSLENAEVFSLSSEFSFCSQHCNSWGASFSSHCLPKWTAWQHS
jgi:hypothetical protein